MDTPNDILYPDAGEGADWIKVWDIFPEGTMTMEKTLHSIFGPDLTHLASLPSSRRKVPREVMRILAPYRPKGFDPSTCSVLDE
jgi:hypothetical protein